MSPGSRSGVHCTRANRPPTAAARALASVVLPRPGRSSSSRWPRASRHASTCSITSGLPRSAWFRADAQPVDRHAVRRRSAAGQSSSRQLATVTSQRSAPRSDQPVTTARQRRSVQASTTRRQTVCTVGRRPGRSQVAGRRRPTRPSRSTGSRSVCRGHPTGSADTQPGRTRVCDESAAAGPPSGRATPAATATRRTRSCQDRPGKSRKTAAAKRVEQLAAASTTGPRGATTGRTHDDAWSQQPDRRRRAARPATAPPSDGLGPKHLVAGRRLDHQPVARGQHHLGPEVQVFLRRPACGGSPGRSWPGQRRTR